MNYWPSEPTNLSETHLPFLNYIINMVNSPGFIATRTFGNNTQTKGWTVFTESNIFGGMSSWMSNYTIANAWYSTHLWQHYRYTLDRDFLKRAFPAMWGAAEWWMERLVLNPNDGTYECPNEYSPENGPGSENATAHSQQLVNELFSNVIEAYGILGVESGISQSDIAALTSIYDKLDKGLRTETYSTSSGFNAGTLANGSSLLREWKTSSYTAGENGHRHLSHLMCLYPFSQVSKYDADPTLFNAAVNSLTLRGDAATGWSLGWKVNCWARAHDGDHAHNIIHNALRHSTSYGTDQSRGGVYYNLFDSHAPFQIDGNFGTCAGIAEMLMQSVTGIIDILPALPSVWANGSVSGLKAVGDNTVDIAWEDGVPVKVTIHSNKGGDIRFRSADFDGANSIVSMNGKRVIPTTVDGVHTITNINAGDVMEVYYNTLIGDVNNDGFVTITDVIALVNIILGKEEEVAAADLNGDGVVTITDAIALVNIILEKNNP
jgi:alpha-L-fucosidase 2